MLEFLLPEGRIVKGHPMLDRAKTDDKDVPVLDKFGVQVQERYIAIAIPKTGVDWKQTDWGQKIVQCASDPVEGYSLAEQSSPIFSWKIVDGDSAVPNRKGNAPKDSEGFPGHWVIHMTTNIPYAVYANREWAIPVTDSNEVKTGDYARIYVAVKGNKPAKTPGVYVNPRMCEITRAGQQIITDNLPSAASVFGGGAAPATTTTTQQPPAPPVAPPAPPAPPVAEEKYDVNGTVYTRSQLLAMAGWTEAHLVNLPKVG